MRTGARRRGFLRVLLHGRSLPAFLLLALLFGLSHLQVAGRNAGVWIAELIIAPADARKSWARRPRSFEPDTRRALDALRFSAFQPSARAPAFRPSAHIPAFQPSARLPGFTAVPSSWASRSGTVGNGSGFSAPTRPVGREARGHNVPVDDASGQVREAPGRLAHLPVIERAAPGGWDVMIRPAAVQPRADHWRPRPMPAAARRAAKAHAAFHRLREKLTGQPGGTSRSPEVAATPPRARPRERRAAARPAPRRLGGRIVGELLPPPGSFRSNEVLAINLTAEGLDKVRDGRYQLVERIELPEFGLTIARLRPPETLNAINGRERLYDLLPQDGFVLNRVYAHYRPGAGRRGTGVTVAAHSGKGCPFERCFGSALINWRPHLAACARNVKVGIVDTGFDRHHPAFAGARYAYREFLPEGSARASDEHGTGVLSLLAGSAGSGTPGLIPDASYFIANAFFADTGGQPISDTLQMLLALHWLKASGVAVVNLSFAGPEDELLHHAVRELTKAGAVVVAAAGNEGPAAPPSYPAAYMEVIAVTAVDRNLTAYRYANRGTHIDLAAPGVDVWTAVPGRLEGPQTGTSFAVPYVTAVVAVTLADAGPAPGDDELAAKRRALARLHSNIMALSGSDRDPTFGAGLVQAPAFCGASETVAVAASAAPDAQTWAGTVHRAAGLAEPLGAGWVSTVHAMREDGAAR